MGGPDGGDGGKGGDVIVRADSNLATLLDFTYRDHWEAERGDHGSGSNKTGHSGADITLPVPPGTVIRNKDTGELIGEVLEDGDSFVIAKGGRGGKGNSWFATSVHRSPREWQPGEDGELLTLELELKLIADVGLVGQPNAGKSTLLSVISAATPKSATTPSPRSRRTSASCRLSDNRTFVVADIPGIIEGAHEGRDSASSSSATSSARGCSPSSFPSTRSTGRRSTTSSATRSRSTPPSWRKSRIAWSSRRWTCWAKTSPRQSTHPTRSASSPSPLRAGQGLEELKLAWWRRLLDMRKASLQPIKDVVLP